MGVIEIVLLVVGCVLGVAALVYGFIRKASRTSWIGWQIMLLFALTFLLDVIPKPEGNGTLYFWLVVSCFLVLLGADLALGGLIRRFAINRPHPKKGAVVASRFFGALCALMNIAVFFLVLGGLAFGIIDALPTRISALEGFLESGFWRGFLAGHFYDLFIVAVCFVFVRAGLRLGVLRGIYYLLMLALTFGAFLAAYLLVTKVGFFASWGAGLGGLFSSLSPAGASVLGYGIIILLFFAVFFAVVMGLGALLHWGLRNLISVRVVGILASILLGLLFFVVFFAGMCLVNYGVAYLAMQTEGSLAPIASIAEAAGKFLSSSPFSAAFYRYNPFVPLLGL